MKIKRKILLISIILFIPFATGFFLFSFQLKNSLLLIYEDNQSIKISDRNNQIIFTKPNSAGYYTEYSNEIPEEFKKLLLQKEDKYFYYHFGVNPVSSLRALYKYATEEQGVIASSTITQQLAKILLRNETERNLKNKFTEVIYAISLETHLSKEKILEMYLNSIYFGNSVQGLNQASRLYFDSQPDLLSDEQNIKLLATISAPSNTNPFANSKVSEIKIKQEKFNNHLKNESYFELRSLNIDCENNCNLTIDQELTKNLREILKRNLLSLSQKDVSNGAIIVIKLPENELLSIVGSPDSTISSDGYQINMAKETRPIGSTIKPLLYLKGFENDLRPYTLVEDKEYKYTIESGFAFYPKNYDYEYRGQVNLHYALTNSLNVPTVKVLEYTGIDNFNKFLLDDLEFSPAQDIENYQLSIALGGLEMDLLALSYYFTIFPNEGKLLPLKIKTLESSAERLQRDGFFPSRQSLSAEDSDETLLYQTTTNFSQNKKIADQKYIQLINKVLSDRKTGIEQFGMKSNLNLLQDNYAVKTGTSREFCDSWTIGYTPDFLVGVWVGNSNNTPMNQISGQSGAGAIWNEAMNLLINSKYNKKTPFEFNLIQEFYNDKNIEYGLVDDNYEKNKNLLENNNLILNPHNGDIFLLEEITQIPLRAREEVEWFIDEQFIGVGKEIIFDVENFGDYEIRAVSENGKEEIVKIFVEEK